MDSKYSEELIELCKSVTAKRPKTVIDHILQYGYITTEELKDKYGYNHPPRAIRDVREHGIPIVTFRVTGTDGRKIASYRFGELGKNRYRKLSGRTALSKKIKQYLVDKYGCKCFIYLEIMNERELQIDHRIPYEVGGDIKKIELNPEDFMLLSSSANRAKSWSCEHCENWLHLKNKEICITCYWAYPENYSHVSMLQIRRVDILWNKEEVDQFEKLKSFANKAGQEIPTFIKKLIKKALMLEK
ncbi:MAG: HNH endonuclease [Deltaproteobacteria bacterium]|nr:HNH endonuclease [Deltaproteobacteria bacterium]